MLTVINRYNHGYIAIPVIIACKTHNFFTRLKQKPISQHTIDKVMEANSGHLHVALKLLRSMGWLVINNNNDYQLTPKADLNEKIVNDVLKLLDFPIDAYLRKGHDNNKLSLEQWVDYSVNGWGIEDDLLPDLLDGLLMIPLLLGIHRCGLYDKKNKRIRLEHVSAAAREDIRNLFIYKAWCSENKNNFDLTEIGKFMMDRSMNMGTVASYTPMLRNMGDLLFGDCAAVFGVDDNGHESHVERTLNVVSSGFQHERYFRDVEDVVLAIFNQLPFENQPRYVADMGCGDGTFLKRVYETVSNKSERGKVLDEFPLTLIGIDFNEKALAATSASLHAIDHFVIHGDIGNPHQMEEDLHKRVADIDSILYIRSFLDHDRPYIAPKYNEKVIARQSMPYQGVYVDAAGALIEPKIAIQSLVEHLQRWASIQTRYGIIILEVHCLSAQTTGRFLDESENLHFDAYHSFSKQFLTEADAFVMSAAEAGLIPQPEYSKRYSKTFPYTRVTINYFRKQPYTIRHAVISDAPVLAQLELAAFPPAIQATAGEISERINVYPLGQSVLEVNGGIVGVIYSHRTVEIQTDDNEFRKRDWNHVEDGPYINLLYLVLSPSIDKKLGNDLIEFMYNYSLLKSEIEGVEGQERCQHYLKLSGQPNYHLNAQNELSNSIEKFVKSFDLHPKDDTIHAELALEAFGAKWMLRIFQEMGVFKQGDEHYKHAIELAEKLNILPKYFRLFESLLGILERHRLLLISPQGITTTKAIETFALADIEQSCHVFEQSFRGNYPNFMPFLELMFSCLRKYREVLVGECEANDVVFPDGSMALFAGIFKGNCVADYFNNLVAETIYERLKVELNKSPSATFNILEIGAGTGGATNFVVNRLLAFSQNITFYYTDISSSFTRYGKKRLGEKHSWMKFERLNIEKEPAAQGFQSKSFDIIYASNVLHDTKYLTNTLKQIKTLIKDGGLLILNEFTVMKDLLLYTGGLLHGWWLFEDPEHRLENSCLLSVDQWHSILGKTGFNNFNAYGLPFEVSLQDCRQSVLFCEATENVVELKPRGVDEQGDSQSVSHIDLTLTAVLSDIIGKKRMAVISPELPLMEQGLDSLELLEFRALLGKQLGIKLGAPFLFQYNTILKIGAYIKTLVLPTDADDGVISKCDTNASPVPARNGKIAQAIENSVSEIIGAQRMTGFSPEIPLMELGLDSLELLELRSLLSRKLGVKLQATFLFQYNTAEKIHSYIQPQTITTKAEAVSSIKDSPVNNACLASQSSDSNQIIKKSLKNLILRIIGEKRMAEFSPDRPLMEIGLDSLEYLELRALLAKQLNVKLNATFLFQYNTAQKVSDYIQENSLRFTEDNKIENKKENKEEHVNNTENETTYGEIDGKHQKPELSIAPDKSQNNDIAIVGMSLRFPGELQTPEEFWAFLQGEQSAIGEMPKNRWHWPSDIDVEGDKAYLVKGGYLNRVDEFDAPFFRISPKEAELMDPQQRILLELSWAALEDAGYKPSALRGSDTGVYIGACHFEYRKLLEDSDIAQDAYLSTGTSGSIIANRLSYFYDFQGPSILFDTACSSSLVAVQEAVKAIRADTCLYALAGGVNIISNSVNALSYDQAGMLSKDGECYTFDDRANGYVRGEGAAMVLLKKLDNAIQDNDEIYVVIKGSAVNHGGQASSLTAPNPEAQARLILNAIKDANIPANSISYIEAHGTATPLGDPIEVEGLRQAFSTTQKISTDTYVQHCGLGSVKSNMGHLEGAAGMAGLIKTALSLKYKIIPATLNYKNANPEINLAAPFYIANTSRSWIPLTDKNGLSIPRRAGVSAFGFGGANAHVILEEFESGHRQKNISGPYLFILSAKNMVQLDVYVKRYLEHLNKPGIINNSELSELCFTLQTAREELEERLAVVIHNYEQLYDVLQQFATGNADTNALYRGNAKFLGAAGGVGSRVASEIRKEGDKESGIREAQENILQQHNLHDIAKLWTAGNKVQWHRLYRGITPNRIRLPGYPFAKERYWIPQKSRPGVHGSQVNIPLDKPLNSHARHHSPELKPISALHPLLHRNTSTFSEQRFSTLLTGQEFFLAHHIVQGQPMLPGVAYLEMARAAVAQSAEGVKQKNIKIINVAWISPIIINYKAIQVHVVLFPDESGLIDFEIYTEALDKNNAQTLHCQGTASYSPIDENPVHDLQALKAKCQLHRLSANEFYDAFGEIGINYGPGHKAIDEIFIGSGVALAKLKLPSAVFDTHEQFVLHPSLLDSALQASYAFMIKSGEIIPLLPFALDECEIIDGCTPTMWVSVRQRIMNEFSNQPIFDIDICDAQGRVCVRLKGYTPRALSNHTLPGNSSGKPMLLTPVWDWIAVDKVHINSDLTNAWSNSRVAIVGEWMDKKEIILQYFPRAITLSVNSSDSIDVMVQKLDELGDIEHILWITPYEPSGSLTDNSLIDTQKQGVLRCFRLIKALLQLGYDSKDLQWTVMTTQTQPIFKDDLANPAHASLHGLVGSMAKEYTNWKIRLVDIEAGCDWPFDEIVNLPFDPQGNALVYRSQQWHRQQLIPLQPDSVNRQLYKQHGVYVVIGGAGGIGEAWSEFMIRHYQAKIVWIGRREMDLSIQRKLEALTELGCELHYLSADATDINALKNAYHEIKQRYSHINGVVHSALVLLDQSLVNMDENRFMAGLSAKVDVSVRMAQVFKEEPLDFMMFFSSITAFTKAAGQSNYASGCVFKDIFAHQLSRKLSCAVKVMNWGYWGSVGIVASQQYHDLMAKYGIGSIEPPEAMEALQTLLSGNVDQMAFVKMTETIQ